MWRTWSARTWEWQKPSGLRPEGCCHSISSWLGVRLHAHAELASLMYQNLFNARRSRARVCCVPSTAAVRRARTVCTWMAPTQTTSIGTPVPSEKKRCFFSDINHLGLDHAGYGRGYTSRPLRFGMASWKARSNKDLLLHVRPCTVGWSIKYSSKK